VQELEVMLIGSKLQNAEDAATIIELRHEVASLPVLSAVLGGRGALCRALVIKP
jgi:hypothetical protein